MTAPKIVLVTGGNTGIGYEIVKALLQSPKPYHIILGARSPEKGALALEKLHEEYADTKNTVEALQVDLNSDDSIQKAYEKVSASHGYIDVLLNNAGAAFDGFYNAGQVSLRECFNKAYDTNVSGTNVLTHVFMPLLLASKTQSPSPDPRLIFVAGLSQMTEAAQSYFPTPPLPAGWPKKVDFETIGYRCSKTALNMLMLDWNHKLKEDGVKVWSAGPGFLATDLGGAKEMIKAAGAGDPSEGGKMLRSVVEGQWDEYTGKIVNKDGVMLW